MKTWKTNGVLLRNRQIHDIVEQISPSYVFRHHGLWLSWTMKENFVVVSVEHPYHYLADSYSQYYYPRWI